MNIPIVCTACGQRGKVASLPDDLACVACKTGEHLDLDDREASNSTVTCPKSPSGLHAFHGKPECMFCGVVPPKRTAMGLGPDAPAGLLPNDQPEMGLLGETTYHERVRCSSCFNEWNETVTDPAAPIQNCPRCGSTAVSAAGTKMAVADTRQPAEIAQQRDLESRPASGLSGEDRVDLARLQQQQKGEQPNPYTNANPYKAVRKSADLMSTRHQLADLNGQSITCTYEDDLGVHTVAGVLTYHPPSVIVGRSVTTDFHVISVSPVAEVASVGAPVMATRKTANQYIEKRGDSWVILQKGTGKVLSHHDSEAKAEAAFAAMMANKHGGKQANQDGASDATGPTFTRGEGGDKTCAHVRCGNQAVEDGLCPQHKKQEKAESGWTYASKTERFAVKVEQITEGVLASNPGMERSAAKKIALKTVGLYPKVAG